ncbi:hypothetical protein LCGC14_0607770 [marine sediment metagenome]|uniref:Major capsid protein n=1 Tax=marine sediment metagenome TaxID=412755 RepID=A0A0F9R8T2_9ZZZZ
MTAGTYSLVDLLQQRFASAAEFGLDTINEILQRDLANYNSQVNDQMGLFADPLVKQSRIYGVSAVNSMTEVDEFGQAPSNRNLPGVTVSFPLSMYKSALGWTSKYMEIATPREIASKFLESRRGHAQQLILQMRRSIFNSNNFTHIDKLTNGVSLAIKRLINADSADIPDSPAGATFDGSTHDHYNARAAALANADVNGLVSDVTEHGNTRGVKIIVTLGADKTAISALSLFIPISDPGLIYHTANETRRKEAFEDLENQLIGFWGDTSVEVWVKPWGLTGYFLCVATGMPEKPIGFRQRKQTALQGLRILPSISGEYPLLAQNMEAEFGMGIWNRTAGAVLYTGATSWVNPAI